MSDISILIATYNGRQYLREQLASILNQTHTVFSLCVRDDGSSDGTVDVTKTFVDDERVSIVPSFENLGAIGNFETLLCEAQTRGAEHIFLSDQDDVWLENKVECQLRLMKDTEKRCGKEIPLLVHSDLEVVDRGLDMLHGSLMQYQGVFHENNDPLSVLLAQNFVTGCTVLINRSLLEIALPIPKEVLMHDWWLALCAATFGKIEYIDRPLVKYRQHGANEVGAKCIKTFLNPFKTNWKKHWLQGRKHLFQSLGQARVLAERIKEHDPSNENLALVESYAALAALPCWKRLWQLKRNNIHCQSRLRHYLMLTRILSLPQRTDE